MFFIGEKNILKILKKKLKIFQNQKIENFGKFLENFQKSRKFSQSNSFFEVFGEINTFYFILNTRDMFLNAQNDRKTVPKLEKILRGEPEGSFFKKPPRIRTPLSGTSRAKGGFIARVNFKVRKSPPQAEK